jgi:hypothetical protein
MNSKDLEIAVGRAIASISEADTMITAITWGLSELERHGELEASAGVTARMVELAGDIETLTLIQRTILKSTQMELEKAANAWLTAAHPERAMAA